MLLPNGGTWTISVNVRPGAAGTLSARVVVSGAEPDPNPANDSTVVSTDGPTPRVDAPPARRGAVDKRLPANRTASRHCTMILMRSPGRGGCDGS